MDHRQGRPRPRQQQLRRKTLNNQTDYSDTQVLNETGELNELPVKPPKKPFVEPTLSLPVDVLEATSFFQASTVESSTV